MTDHIGGIAVVEPLDKFPGLFRICLSLCHADGHVDPCSLVFHDAANPPADVKAAQEKIGEPIWCFRKDHPRHGILDCQPSVRQFVTVEGKNVDRFHNTFNWRVQYVWLKYTTRYARFNIWKILNQWGEDEQGQPMPPVTSDTFEKLRQDGYIC